MRGTERLPAHVAALWQSRPLLVQATTWTDSKREGGETNTEGNRDSALPFEDCVNHRFFLLLMKNENRWICEEHTYHIASNREIT